MRVVIVCGCSVLLFEMCGFTPWHICVRVQPDNYRDVFFEGGCDEGCIQLCKGAATHCHTSFHRAHPLCVPPAELGWLSELERVQTAGLRELGVAPRHISATEPIPPVPAAFSPALSTVATPAVARGARPTGTGTATARVGGKPPIVFGGAPRARGVPAAARANLKPAVVSVAAVKTGVKLPAPTTAPHRPRPQAAVPGTAAGRGGLHKAAKAAAVALPKVAAAILKK